MNPLFSNNTIPPSSSFLGLPPICSCAQSTNAFLVSIIYSLQSKINQLDGTNLSTFFPAVPPFMANTPSQVEHTIEIKNLREQVSLHELNQDALRKRIRELESAVTEAQIREQNIQTTLEETTNNSKQSSENMRSILESTVDRFTKQEREWVVERSRMQDTIEKQKKELNDNQTLLSSKTIELLENQKLVNVAYTNIQSLQAENNSIKDDRIKSTEEYESQLDSLQDKLKETEASVNHWKELYEAASIEIPTTPKSDTNITSSTKIDPKIHKLTQKLKKQTEKVEILQRKVDEITSLQKKVTSLTSERNSIREENQTLTRRLSEANKKKEMRVGEASKHTIDLKKLWDNFEMLNLFRNVCMESFSQQPTEPMIRLFASLEEKGHSMEILREYAIQCRNVITLYSNALTQNTIDERDREQLRIALEELNKSIPAKLEQTDLSESSIFPL